jgi:hypothetical protein
MSTLFKVFQFSEFFDFFDFLFYYSIAYGAWPSGKATGFDPVIRRFESFRPSPHSLLGGYEIFVQ